MHYDREDYSGVQNFFACLTNTSPGQSHSAILAYPAVLLLLLLNFFKHYQDHGYHKQTSTQTQQDIEIASEETTWPLYVESHISYSGITP